MRGKICRQYLLITSIFWREQLLHRPVRSASNICRHSTNSSNSFGIPGEAAALDEIRAMFAQYEKPGMPTLSSEIEAMREEH